MSDKKEILISLFTEAKLKIAPCSYNLLHLNTIDNYIRYFDNLNNKNQDNAFNLLFNYISLINKGINVNIEGSLELFQEYVSPLIIFYEKDAGFTTYVGTWIILIWLTIIELLVFFTIGNTFFLVFVGLLALSYYVYFLNKKRVGKVHGFRY